MEDRYKGTAENAKTRSVVSLGLSCFKLTHVDVKPRTQTGNMSDDSFLEASPSSSCHTWNFLVQTYNIMALCQEEYVVEPSSLKFLVEHGFDFNKQYSCGVGYYRGNDKVGNSIYFMKDSLEYRVVPLWILSDKLAMINLLNQLFCYAIFIC